MAIQLYALLLQIPGLDVPDLTLTERVTQLWGDTGFMRWPLAFCLALGIVVPSPRGPSPQQNTSVSRTKQVPQSLAASRRSVGVPSMQPSASRSMPA